MRWPDDPRPRLRPDRPDRGRRAALPRPSSPNVTRLPGPRHVHRRPRPSGRATRLAARPITADRIVHRRRRRADVPPASPGSTTSTFHTSDTSCASTTCPRRMIDRRRRLRRRGVRARLLLARRRGHRAAAAAALLRDQDERVAERFTALAQDRCDVRLEPRSPASRAARRRHSCCTCPDGATLEADVLLVATGRTPNADRLDVEHDRHRGDADGRVVVDEYQRTTVEGIWALGDVSSPYQLKHVANHEARIVQHNLLHPDDLRASRPPVRAERGVHPPAGRRGRADRAGRRDAGLRYVTIAAGLRRHRLRLGDGGHHRASSSSSPTRPPANCSARTSSARRRRTVIQPLIQAMSFGLDARSMAPRPVLDPPGDARGRRERAC